MPSMPTVFRWLSQHEEFRAMYTAAREEAITTAAASSLQQAREFRGDPPRSLWASLPDSQRVGGKLGQCSHGQSVGVRRRRS
jgi:hypothetical protein